MIRWTTFKALMVGVALLILTQALYVGVMLRVEHHEMLRMMLLLFPGIAALTTAYLAPKNKILAGTSLAVWGAAIAMLSAAIYEQFGLHVDSIGGPLATFAILVVYYFALSIVGSLLGHFLSCNKTCNQNKPGLGNRE